MRYTITSQQLNQFRKDHTIELEGLYTPQEVELVKNELISTPTTTGRDLHRENPPLVSALHCSRLGQGASALCTKKRLRIAFTQFVPFPHLHLPIKMISPLSDTFGGCLLDLETGKTTFYDDEVSIDFSQFSSSSFFIAFATDKGRYVFQEKDPHTHLLKKLGYGFGDLISVETHPLICK